MLPRSRVAVIVIAAALLAQYAMCAPPDGILRTGPGTTIDGTAALDGMHVFGGQLLRTAAGRFSELLTHGTSLRLLGDTQVRFNGGSADLLTGGLMLNSSTRFATRSECVNVTPQSEIASRYLVQVHDKVVYVTAQQNDVIVTARKTVRVPSGKTVAVYCEQPAQPILFVGSSAAAKVIMGAAVAATPIGTLPISASKQDLSPPSPSHR
ncbi:MAG: hypothetical protein ACXVZV_03290 [Terriglobales bacterium]